MLKIIGWLLGGFTSTVWIGVAVAAAIAGLAIWHSANFVSRDRMEQWEKAYNGLVARVEQRERIRQADETKAEADKAEVEQMDAEREQERVEDRKGDDPVLLNRGDVDRLRSWTERQRKRAN
jgi:hypothetical protein